MNLLSHKNSWYHSWYCS